MAPALQTSRKSFPSDNGSRRVSTAPPYPDAPFSASASRSLRPSRDITSNKDKDAADSPSSSQATSPSENKKAKFLKRDHSPTPRSTSSPEAIDLVSHSGESTPQSPEPAPPRKTRASLKNRTDDDHDTYGFAGDSQLEMDKSSSTSKSQKSGGKKNQASQQGKKRAYDSTEKQSVEKSADNKKKKAQTSKQNGNDNGEEDGPTEGQDNWEVEAIVGARTVNNAREYLVKWKGDEWDDTWEVEENVQHCQDLVREFENKQEQRKMKIEEEKAQKKAMKDLQKKLQNEKYEQKKKEAEEVAEKKRKEAEGERARKEEEEAAKREERRKEREAKADKSKSPTSDVPIQKALKVQTRPPRNKPLSNPSSESSSSPKRKAGPPPSFPKRKKRASTSESPFSPSKSPTPLPTPPIAPTATKSKLNDGSSPASSISPNLKSIAVAATKRSAMDRNTQVVKILAHKPKELEIKRLEDVDFLINYAGSPNEFVSYETCLEKIPAHLCEYLAQNGPIFYPSRR